MEHDDDNAPLPVIQAHGFKTFSIVIYILSALVSLLAFFYGLLIVSLDRNVWRNHIVRVIVVVQILNCLRFIFRILSSFIPIYSEFGCRALLFLNDTFTIFPVNLCVYCVVYLQLLVIHQVSPYKRRPKIVLMTLAVLTAVVPQTTSFYIPPSSVGIQSYCKIPLNFGHSFYIYYILTVALWQYLSGLVCIISVFIIGIHILQARRASQRIAEGSTYSCGISRNFVQKSGPKALHRTLIAIIWYPITPIVSQWLNLILFSVSYYRKRTYTGLEFVNVVMLGLQSVLLGIGLVVYPAVQRVFKREIWNRWVRSKEKIEAQSAISPNEAYIERGLPPLNYSRMSSIGSISSDSVSNL